MAALGQVGLLFRRVADAHAFIVDETPATPLTVSLELCVVKSEERENYWRLHLVDGGVERERSNFVHLVEVYDMLENSRRAKYSFKLTVWKTRNPSADDEHFRVGTSRRFDNVFGLRVFNGGPTGNYQMRRHQGGNDAAVPFNGFNAIVADCTYTKPASHAHPAEGIPSKSNAQIADDDAQVAAVV